jgi:hypothetical protein
MSIAMLNRPREEYVPLSPIASFLCGAKRGMAKAKAKASSERRSEEAKNLPAPPRSTEQR